MRRLCIYLTIALFLGGCTQHMKTFECKAKCDNDTQLECKTSVNTNEIDIP